MSGQALAIMLIPPAIFCATLAGGLFALVWSKRLHLFLGFSAGAVIGVALFDLLPEAVEIDRRTNQAMELFPWVAAGFLFYLVLGRLVVLRQFYGGERLAISPGTLGASSLCLHSYLDGVAVGLGFQVSPAAGAIIAAGVIAHDFSDGLNTVNIALKGGVSRASALKWLFLDASTPLLGVATAFVVPIPEDVFGLALGFFGGLFLYLGASELVPESYRVHPKFLTTAMTILGATFIYAIVRVAD